MQAARIRSQRIGTLGRRAESIRLGSTPWSLLMRAPLIDGLAGFPEAFTFAPPANF